MIKNLFKTTLWMIFVAAPLAIVFIAFLIPAAFRAYLEENLNNKGVK